MPALVSRAPEIELLEPLFTALMAEMLLKEPLLLPIVLIVGPSALFTQRGALASDRLVRHAVPGVQPQPGQLPSR